MGRTAGTVAPPASLRRILYYTMRTIRGSADRPRRPTRWDAGSWLRGAWEAAEAVVAGSASPPPLPPVLREFRLLERLGGVTVTCAVDSEVVLEREPVVEEVFLLDRKKARAAPPPPQSPPAAAWDYVPRTGWGWGCALGRRHGPGKAPSSYAPSPRFLRVRCPSLTLPPCSPPRADSPSTCTARPLPLSASTSRPGTGAGYCLCSSPSACPALRTPTQASRPRSWTRTRARRPRHSDCATARPRRPARRGGLHASAARPTPLPRPATGAPPAQSLQRGRRSSSTSSSTGNGGHRVAEGRPPMARLRGRFARWHTTCGASRPRPPPCTPWPAPWALWMWICLGSNCAGACTSPHRASSSPSCPRAA